MDLSAQHLSSPFRFPLDPPWRRIYNRLRYVPGKTDLSSDERSRMEGDVLSACAVCEPQGRFRILPIGRRGTDAYLNEQLVTSQDLQKLLGNCDYVALAFATVGSGLSREIARLEENGRHAALATFDAVGSEMTESAIRTVQARIEMQVSRGGYECTRRFAPGYGDVSLEWQTFFWDTLQLAELGIQLTDRYLLIPEKSTTCFIGLESKDERK